MRDNSLLNVIFISVTELNVKRTAGSGSIIVVTNCRLKFKKSEISYAHN